jgi:Flp pilus assembly protein TadG
MKLDRLSGFLRRFLREEGGVISVQNLFILFGAGLVSAQAVDVTHLYTTRTQIQVAADVAAHAAIMTRNRNDAPTDPTEAANWARDRAISAVQWMLPGQQNGHVVERPDILFGTWDTTTRTFRVDNQATDAVLVTTGRERASGNAVPTFLYTLAGVGSMSVAASSVYRVIYPCPNDGIASVTRVDLRSNNDFFDNICLYSPIVSLNSNNSFETGTMVQMPDTSVWFSYNPNSSFESNTGLRDALRNGLFDFYILDRIRVPGTVQLRPGDLPLDQALTSDTPERPPYIDRATVANVITLSASTTLTPSSFTPGRVHRITCNNSSGRIDFSAGVFSRFVLLTNCQVRFNGGTELQDLVISTTNTDPESFQTPSGGGDGLQIGRDDNCAAGGGVRLLTRGGLKAAAKMEIYGSQILALGEVQFAAGSGGIINEAEGLSIIAQGMVSGTSNMSFSGCPNGTNDVLKTPYFQAAW